MIRDGNHVRGQEGYVTINEPATHRSSKQAHLPEEWKNDGRKMLQLTSESPQFNGSGVIMNLSPIQKSRNANISATRLRQRDGSQSTTALRSHVCMGSRFTTFNSLVIYHTKHGLSRPNRPPKFSVPKNFKISDARSCPVSAQCLPDQRATAPANWCRLSTSIARTRSAPS